MRYYFVHVNLGAVALLRAKNRKEAVEKAEDLLNKAHRQVPGEWAVQKMRGSLGEHVNFNRNGVCYLRTK